MSRRVWKLQDFSAHGGLVHCARLGEKSGQVLASGGDDKRVNIWKVGKPQVMMSLTGHTSAVECLVFDKQEEVLVVGCSGGSMQIWNLEYRKMNGTLSGHRTACSSVEFHPYGEFFASGSADTNLKIWDLRRKSCIQTYKGHTGAITSIRFSPHGRWVATGGADNQVKLWDLTAGKLMKDLDLHRGPITSLAFHPKEYLMATGSADCSMKLWSLETFKATGTTELTTAPVQAVKFFVEDQSVISATAESLRTYSLDGLTKATDSIEVDWRGLQDTRLCIPEEKLIAISTEGPQMAIWVADLQRRDAASAGKGGGYGRVNSRGAASVPSTNAAATPVSNLRRPEERQPERQPDKPPVPTGGRHRPGSEDGLDGGDVPEDVNGLGAVADGRGQPPPAQGRRRTALPTDEGSARVGGAFSSASPHHMDSTPKSGGEDRAIGSRSPKAAASPFDGAARPRPNSDNGGGVDQLQSMTAQHAQMRRILQRRGSQVMRLKELWIQGNLAALLADLQLPQDHAVLCDLMKFIMTKNQVGSLNLDACHALLPAVLELLTSKYADFVATGLQFTEVLLRHFGDLIAETRLGCAKIPERHLDLAREERLQKCNACFEQFREVFAALNSGQVSSQECAGLRAALTAFLH
eukprot:CAMPEP_0178374190 /NCGR_PEP_ID=MMETSP0689_2-20121128/2249_1 /TAXON_ID=160604 /ORGANISM="Amphidinium massartii, Strain CS-259" /LENGTH=636 /DNA_ID=CAMNT_0019994153 /DNA_START=60 /DNA_END=1967 /DNA_ORIENTATION=-